MESNIVKINPQNHTEGYFRPAYQNEVQFTNPQMGYPPPQNLPYATQMVTPNRIINGDLNYYSEHEPLNQPYQLPQSQAMLQPQMYNMEQQYIEGNNGQESPDQPNELIKNEDSIKKNANSKKSSVVHPETQNNGGLNEFYYYYQPNPMGPSYYTPANNKAGNDEEDTCCFSLWLVNDFFCFNLCRLLFFWVRPLFKLFNFLCGKLWEFNEKICNCLTEYLSFFFRCCVSKICDPIFSCMGYSISFLCEGLVSLFKFLQNLITNCLSGSCCHSVGEVLKALTYPGRLLLNLIDFILKNLGGACELVFKVITQLFEGFCRGSCEIIGQVLGCCGEFLGSIAS